MPDDTYQFLAKETARHAQDFHEISQKWDHWQAVEKDPQIAKEYREAATRNRRNAQRAADRFHKYSGLAGEQ